MKVSISENEFLTVIKKDTNQATELLGKSFKKIENQNLVVKEMIVSPIVKDHLSSLFSNNQKILEKNQDGLKFWTAKITVNKKVRRIYLFS